MAAGNDIAELQTVIPQEGEPANVVPAEIVNQVLLRLLQPLEPQTVEANLRNTWEKRLMNMAFLRIEIIGLL